MNYRNQEENYYPRAILISSGILLAFLIISYFLIIGNPIPQVGTGGIIVNYGSSPEGMGDEYMSVEDPSMDPNANEAVPDQVIPEANPEEVASQQLSDKTVATQDMEDAPEVVTKKQANTNTPVATPEKEESKPTVNPNALYKGKKNNNDGRGDGTGTTPGNQGSKQGDPLSPDYGEGGSGFGDVGLDVANRSFVVAPQIEDKGQITGKVAVQITVNRAGEVINARAGVRGTTINDAAIWEKCERAILNAKLNALENAPVSQQGIIVINFKVK